MTKLDRDSGGSAFDSLTSKQHAVLALLANSRTTKEMAAILDVSVPAVNRRIELLRSRFGGITRHELARRYRDWSAASGGEPVPAGDGVEAEMRFLHLAGAAAEADDGHRDDPTNRLDFRDSIKLRLDAPWTTNEPKVVPGVLDGENATLTRGATIAVMLLAIVASLVLGLAAAQALTEAVGS